MTTESAERQYLGEHLAQSRGRELAVHNPHGRLVKDLPAIYGFNNGGPPGWMSGELVASDGTALGGHCCSSESYMLADLGMLAGTRSDRHETFRAHYPDGYRMEWVPTPYVATHEGLALAFERNAALRAAAT